jgi:hypothetical protein
MFFTHVLLTSIRFKLTLLIEVMAVDQKRSGIMKTMTVREGSIGRKTKINAKTTYQKHSGEWVAVVDKAEFREACSYVCKGVRDCAWENLHVQADLDDDGKEYRVVSN